MALYNVPMRPRSAEQPLMTRDEVAERWQCHPRTVCRRVKVLGIKPIRLGHRSVRYRVEDIFRAEEARCQ